MCNKDARAIPLTDEQRERLVQALADGSTDNRGLIADASDVAWDLAQVIDSAGGRKAVAVRIVNYMAPQMQLPRLICNAMTAMPLNEPLRELAAELGVGPPPLRPVPPALSPPAPPPPVQATEVGRVVDSIDDVFRALRRHAHQPAVLNSLRDAAGPLEQAAIGIKRLACYKALHDILHLIPLRLGVIELAIGDLRQNGPAASQAAEQLRIYADDVQRWASQAAIQAAGVGGEYEVSQEEQWIKDLETYGFNLRMAAAEASPDRERPEAAASIDTAVKEPAARRRKQGAINELTDALEGILGLQRSRVSTINKDLVNVARELPLPMLVVGLDRLVAVVGTLPSPTAATSLDTARDDVNALHKELTATIEAHKEWQMVDRDLILEQAGPATNAVTRERWLKILHRIIGRAPEESWAVILAAALTHWRMVERGRNRKATSEAFRPLQEACRDRFIAVDKMLLDLCGKLTRIIAPLDRLKELAR